MKTLHDDESLERYLRELASIQPLTNEEEIELLLHVQAHDQEEELASKRLIKANLHLVASIAVQYSASDMAMLEIIQEGNLGLFTAVNTFDENRGAFEDHAASCVKDAISKVITEVKELKNRMAKIEALIRRDSEDFFDDEDLRALRVAIRIACEFLDFLHSFEDSPNSDQASYIVGTIRAGLDEFVRVSGWGRILTDSRWGKDDIWNPPSSVSEMKASYNSTFQQLLKLHVERQGHGNALSALANHAFLYGRILSMAVALIVRPMDVRRPRVVTFRARHSHARLFQPARITPHGTRSQERS